VVHIIFTAYTRYMDIGALWVYLCGMAYGRRMFTYNGYDGEH